MPAVMTQEDFGKLYQERYSNLSINQGDVLRGVVVSVERDFAMVDVGFKSEGAIELEQFRNFEGNIEVNPGDEVDVVVEEIENKQGQIILSKERADALKSWDRVAEVFERDDTIQGVVVSKIKGGMSVNLGGIKAFLPGSQIDLKPVKSLERLVGQRYAFKILKLNKIKGNIVLSRRAILEEEREAKKVALLENLSENSIVKGIVKNITDYGAFVDLGGIDGLLHITDITWGRMGHPSEVLKIGDEIDVMVLKYDRQSEKVSLGLKQLKENPWDQVINKYTPGERVNGKVVNLTDYGVFIEIADGIEGLVHVSELSWSKKIKHPSKVVKVGDEVESVILDIDKENRRISLGVKQLEPNPWNQIEEKFPVGSKVKGSVRNITDFGVFVGLDGEEIDGLVHISDLTWDQNVKHPSEILKKGDEVEVMVLSVDKENERFALGIKQLSEDPWATIQSKFKQGSFIKGKILELQPKQIAIDVGEEKISGVLAHSDLSPEDRANPGEKYKVGDEIEARVKRLSEKDGKVFLSVKAFEKAQEKQNMRDFLSRQGEATVKLMDSLKKPNS